MNINRMLMLATAVASLTANAQVKLNDKNANAYDLGYGVEISNFLSTASATTITGEELQQTSATNLAQALYGRLPGLTALSQGGFSGDENKGATFNIRGFHTLNDTGILILVDGYERPIDRLSVEEVESVTVLKDAAATALLGHEGINGAILVKTKRGAEGKTRVKVGYSHKFQFDPEFADMVDGYGYASAFNRARRNDGLSAAYTEQELNLFKDGSDPYFYPNVNWRDLTFKNTAEEDHAYVSVYGGTNKVKYYTHIDYTDVRGALKDTKQADYNAQLRQSKANIRTNLDFSLTNTTLMSVNLFGMFQESKRPSDLNADDATAAVYDLPASAFPYKTSTGIWGGNEAYGDANPIAKIQESGFYKTHQRQLWVDAKLSQKLDFLLDGLSVFVSAGYANSSIYAENSHKSHQYGYERYTGAIGDKNNVALNTFGNKETNLTFSNWNAGQWWKAKATLGFNYKRSFFDNDQFFMITVVRALTDVETPTIVRTSWESSTTIFRTATLPTLCLRVTAPAVPIPPSGHSHPHCRSAGFTLTTTRVCSTTVSCAHRPASSIPIICLPMACGFLHGMLRTVMWLSATTMALHGAHRLAPSRPPISRRRHLRASTWAPTFVWQMLLTSLWMLSTSFAATSCSLQTMRIHRWWVYSRHTTMLAKSRVTVLS